MFKLTMPRRKPRQIERPLTIALWEYLAFRKVFAFVNYQPPGRNRIWQHHSSVGVADIIGIYQGRPLAIEVKIPGGSYGTTDKQKKFLEEFTRQGGIAMVATSVEDIDAVLFPGQGRAAKPPGI